MDGRTLRLALILISLTSLAAGLAFSVWGSAETAHLIWSAGAVPVVVALGVAIIRDLVAGRMGVDAVALVSMAAALVLGESLAAVVVAVMYAGGSVLEDFAVGRAERNLQLMVDRAPRFANRIAGDAIETVAIESVSLGDRLLVRAGEVIPVDGMIASAAASLDESALTGEPIPAEHPRGSLARSGTVNAGEAFEMDVSAVADDSTYAGIVRLVNAARTTRSPFIRMADRYALILLPVSLGVAGAAWALSGDPIRGLAVLVVATPCPLILAAPVAFISGISQAARRGILVKGSGPLEALARARTAIFDKTGTLTVGGARLIAVDTTPGQDPDELLGLVASLEQASQHIVATAITAAARQKGFALTTPTNVREAPGAGLEGTVGGRRVQAGSADLVLGGRHAESWLARSLRRASWRSALSVVVSIDGRISGVLLLADQLRPESSRTIDRLRAAGITRVIMVSGDRADAVESIGAALGLDAVLAERLPGEKVDAVAIESSIAPTMMIGDGINDAPALAAADVGIALGARGATASSEAADVVILVERLDRVADAMAIAHRTRRIALQSIVVGLALSGIGMAAAAVGWLTPVAGALIQEVIDVAVILNALRALGPGHGLAGPRITEGAAMRLLDGHVDLEAGLDRLRQIADDLDEATPVDVVSLIGEASRIASQEILRHERDDERRVYPGLSDFMTAHGLAAMNRAHREIRHLARMLETIGNDLTPEDADRFLVRDAQRIIQSLETIVRLHSAQEDEIYTQAGEPLIDAR